MKIIFEHIALRVKNPERMKDFLLKLLSLKVGFRPEFSFPGYWLYSKDIERSLIHIFHKDASFYKKDLINEDFDEEYISGNIVNHICFFSDNYEEIIKRISNLNIDYSINLVPNSPIEQIFIKGPENLIIEIQAIPKNKRI